MNYTNNSQISYENFHPNAKKILKDEFYWSPIEETGPFGSDAGFDAFYGFREWRKNNHEKSPVEFLEILLDEWNFEKTIDFKELNEDRIKEFINNYSIGDLVIIDIDNAIIALGFGQYVLEGIIDNDIKELTVLAIERELKPIMIELFSPDYREKRTKQLKLMQSAVTKMNTKE
jgi:uncharacterized protein YfeS